MTNEGEWFKMITIVQSFGRVYSNTMTTFFKYWYITIIFYTPSFNLFSYNFCHGTRGSCGFKRTGLKILLIIFFLLILKNWEVMSRDASFNLSCSEHKGIGYLNANELEQTNLMIRHFISRSALYFHLLIPVNSLYEQRAMR